MTFINIFSLNVLSLKILVHILILKMRKPKHKQLMFSISSDTRIFTEPVWYTNLNFDFLCEYIWIIFKRFKTMVFSWSGTGVHFLKSSQLDTLWYHSNKQLCHTFAKLQVYLCTSPVRFGNNRSFLKWAVTFYILVW